MLFNEPKLLKSRIRKIAYEVGKSFSALQRAEIAEMVSLDSREWASEGFSALQRAEIAEILMVGEVVLCAVEFQCSSTSRNC